jgi:GxxExxY protein
MSIVYPEEGYLIMGACFEVYKEIGCGFLEAVYQECLEIELCRRNIPFKAQPLLSISYRGAILKCKYTPDLICFDKIIIELKTVSILTDQHRAQVFNYLRATGLRLGLLINFSHFPKLQSERIVL